MTEIFETISISEDGILENNETFSVTVASRSTPHLVTDIPANTVVTIIDNDGKSLSGALILQHDSCLCHWYGNIKNSERLICLTVMINQRA